MPIITCEYTSNLSIDKKIRPFLLEMHNILVDVIKTDLPTCRSQIIKIDEFVIGNGDAKNASIVLTVRMLPGRSDDTKHRLGKILLDKIYHDFSDEIKKYDTQVRVYLTETDKKYYYGLDNI